MSSDGGHGVAVDEDRTPDGAGDEAGGPDVEALGAGSPDGPVDEAGTADDAASGRGSTAWIAWTVAAALAVVAGVAIVQWQAVVGPQTAIDEASAAAAAYVTTLSNWDAADGLEDTYAALQTGATASFRSEVDEVFGAQTRDDLVTVGAVSVGTVGTVLAGDRVPADAERPESVDVVVIAEQLVVTGPTADPATNTERVTRLRMVRDGEQWLVADLELLSELALDQEGTG